MLSKGSKWDHLTPYLEPKEASHLIWSKTQTPDAWPALPCIIQAKELSVFIQYHSITVSFCSDDFVLLSVLQVYTKFIYPQSVYICVYLGCSTPRPAHCCSFLVHSQLSYNLRKTFPYQPVNANIPNVPTSIPSHWPDLLFTYHLASLKWFIHLELPKVRILLNTCFQTGSWYLHGNSRNCLHN